MLNYQRVQTDVSENKVPHFHRLVYHHLVGGFSPPLWKMMECVSWDDDIPNVWKVIIHSCSSHHQPDKTYRGFLKYGYPKTVGFPMGNNQSHGWFCNFWTQIQPSPMALDRRPPSGHLYRCELRKLPVQSHVGLSMVIQPVFENGEYERKGAYCRLYYHLVT